MNCRGRLSHPLLRLLLGDIGFVYPVMSVVVIGSSLPILRQRRWSLLYDVYWLNLMIVKVNRWQVLLLRRLLELDQNTLCSNLEVSEGDGVGVDEVGDDCNHNNWSQVLATVLQYQRVKPRKRGLNSLFTCPEWGGGGRFSHITQWRDWKWTVNATLAEGHHAETQRTARNLFSFP